MATTVVAVDSLPIAYSGALPLARYAQLVSQDECAFWGVAPQTPSTRACRTIWTLREREEIQAELKRAQDDIEAVVGYPIGERYITGETHRQRTPLLTRYGYIQTLGSEVTTVIDEAATVLHLSDPATLNVTSADAEIDQIRVRHTDTELYISPSSISKVGSVISIQIPRCRLVKPTLADNPTTGLDYSDLDNFATTVAVEYVTTDSEDDVEFTCRTGCTCATTTRAGCGRIVDDRIGIVQIQYSASSSLCACCGGEAQINYLAGRPLDDALTNLIVTLAHARMLKEPCRCEVLVSKWRQLRESPAVLTAERINNPWGTTVGAWQAWQTAHAPGMRLMRGVLAVGGATHGR